MTKVYFRADASQKIGYGHFIRSLALADMLKDHFECIFVTLNPTDFQKKEVEKVCSFIELTNEISLFDDFLYLLKGTEIVFLDNYYFTSDYQKKIKEIGSKLVCIGGNDKHYYVDALINYINTEPQAFSTEKYTKFCFGLEWVILRKPFLNTPSKQSQSIKNKYPNITVCFGGTDQFKITEKAINVVQKIRPDAIIHLIATEAFETKRLKQLEKMSIRTHVDVDAQTIADILYLSNLAILSASTITQEALACETPVMAGYYIDNQEAFYHFLKNNSYIYGLDNLLYPTFEQKLMTSLVNFEQKVENNKKLDVSGIQERYINLFNSL